MVTPKLRYLQDLQREDFAQDPAQKAAIDLLEDLHQRLVYSNSTVKSLSLTAVIRRFFGPSKQPEQGLYLWGGVGRGKTYLMDSFYETLPVECKMRVHFHRFMRRVHSDLREFKGHANPLQKVAKKIADEACVICFDEFFVSDITDAMLLGNLLQGLFQHGVCLVTTSNIPPDQLYPNGLQRQRFLPAISLLKNHCRVVNVDGGVDHRLRKLEKTELYYFPLNKQSDSALKVIFENLRTTDTLLSESTQLLIGGRVIPVERLAGNSVWFDFSGICEGPRSQNDYIDIAIEFHTVFISGIPELGSANDDAARRFINLVDEFYDHNVKLIVSAAQPIQSLYAGGNLAFEFERTKSRLLEMQSSQYLARPHKS